MSYNPRNSSVHPRQFHISSPSKHITPEFTSPVFAIQKQQSFGSQIPYISRAMPTSTQRKTPGKFVSDSVTSNHQSAPSQLPFMPRVVPIPTPKKLSTPSPFPVRNLSTPSPFPVRPTDLAPHSGPPSATQQQPQMIDKSY